MTDEIKNKDAAETVPDAVAQENTDAGLPWEDNAPAVESIAQEPAKPAQAKIAEASSKDTEKSVKKEEAPGEEKKESLKGKIGKFINDKIPDVEADKTEDGPKETSKINDGLMDENSRFRKELSDNRKYSRAVNARNKNAIELLKKYTEDADIDEEVAKSLVKTLEHDLELPEETSVEGVHSPWKKYDSVITEELLNNYVDVTGDSAVDDKIEAFRAYINWLNPGDTETLIDALDTDCKTPMSLLKAILKIGDNYHNTVYKDYKDAGSPDVVVKRLKDENRELREELEALKIKRKKAEQKTSAGTPWLGEYSVGHQQAAESNRSPLESVLPELFGR